MISKPSTSQLLLNMQAELMSRVVPAITDPTLAVEVQMMASVVGALAVRSGHEIAWMREESALIEELATMLQPAGDPALDAALARLRSERTGGLDLVSSIADYELADAVLSAATDAAYSSGEDVLIAAVWDVHETRMRHESLTTGTFESVGRE